MKRHGLVPFVAGWLFFFSFLAAVVLRGQAAGAQSSHSSKAAVAGDATLRFKRIIANYAHQSDAALAVSQHIAKNQQQISAMLSSSFAKRDAAESRSLDGFSQAIRGVDTYQTPSGDHLEVPLGWDHYFSNPNSDQVLLVNGSPPPEIKRDGWV